MWRLASAMVLAAIVAGAPSAVWAQTCSPVFTLSCGDDDHWNNDWYGSTTNVDEYACGGDTYSLYETGEYAYTYVAPGHGDVTVTLSGLSDDLDLFILSDAASACDPTECIANSRNASSDDETVTFTATAGTTYYFVVDGFSGAISEFDLAVTCDLEALCDPAFTLSCGESDTWGTTRFGSTDVVDLYGCSSWNESGREYVYEFVAPSSGSATVALSDLDDGVDLDVFVLDGSGGTCDADTCLTHGSRTATFDIVAGQTYYLAVDGYYGDEGPFTITLNCELENRCSPADIMTCGETVTSRNDAPGSTDVVNGYGCTGLCETWLEHGPEYAYEFVAPVDGEYTAALSDLDADLDVYVLDGSGGDVCNPEACTSCGGESSTWTATAGTTYYIVVDGYGSGETVSDYSLTVTCPPLDTCVAARDVSCGAHIESTTLSDNATDNIDSYTCSTWTENGPEMAYRFTPRASSDVNVRINSLFPDQDLDVFVVEETDGVCDADGCIAHGASETDFVADEGITYYVIVDGYSGDAGDFTLDVTCALGCEPRLSLTCEDGFDEGNNGGDGSTNQIDTYSCVGWDESGPEYAYEYAPTEDGQVTISLVSTEDLDLFVVEGASGECNSDSCVAFGDEEVTFDAIAGTIYYVIVEGKAGAVDDYLIELTCAAAACDVDRDGYDATGADCGGDDCDDGNADINPDEEEICGDGVDQDCDGEDEICPDCTDDDGDGYGTGATCEVEQDCDDSSADIYPGADEVCGDGIDQDCDGSDLECPCRDRDGDGVSAGGGCSPPVDCDDSDDTIYPDAEEVCGDGVDQDCDGADESCPTCEDRDGDRYGTGPGCLGEDCDDYDRTINPGMREECGDGIDQDCDGADEECPTECTDGDGDGYGDGPDCAGPDCDDTNDEINPDARDICGDGIDQDCDGADAECPCDDDDGDGYDAEDCGGDDCDDAKDNVYPGAEEICGDGVDQDCDGEDEACDCPDEDEDGFQDRACGGNDCDDSDETINPDAEDPCGDDIDQNCDGADDCPCEDGDGDGFGTGPRCPDDPDCDDSDDTIYPGAEEECGDGIDQDCDGEDDCCMCSTDDDLDGFISLDCCGGDDCNDANPDINNEADEVCADGIDNNCDGEIDEDGCVFVTESSDGCNCRASGDPRQQPLSVAILALLGVLGLTRLRRR